MSQAQPQALPQPQAQALPHAQALSQAQAMPQAQPLPQAQAQAWLQALPQVQIPKMTFQHPFTHIVSGPTGCGKTTYVKKLLQHNNILIKPYITRIVWIYGYWQPMYDELAKTVHPPIEFIQDIPHDLSDDSFISPNDNNIVVDDMMSTAAKDHRITEFFTERSHHGNLSVISINQNLYHGKDQPSVGLHNIFFYFIIRYLWILSPYYQDRCTRIVPIN